MKIKDILSIQLDNDIKNVIDLNLQSEDEVKEELDGFILTESLATHLSDFLDKFTSDMKETGVWLSGFYGSGISVSASLLWSCRNGQYESTGSLRGDRLAPVSGGAGSRLSGRKRKPDVSGDSDGGIGSASDDHR